MKLMLLVLPNLGVGFRDNVAIELEVAIELTEQALLSKPDQKLVCRLERRTAKLLSFVEYLPTKTESKLKGELK